ncbi:MAG TPA: pilus assembly protein PilM, partial [Opitutales bacterium]|nr:pilus assembly protein PilM [Opitutales bacterium]
AWLPALAEGLRDLARSNSRFRGKATFILPGYQLLIKPIKIPHVEESKRGQIVAFEAQNNIPFPLAEAVWGSQVIADDGIESEVLLAAQKAEASNRFCGLMSTIGLEPVALQPSSLLDFNAYKLVHPSDLEDTLLINIGARSSNLTFISPAGLFIRNISVGGNSLTQAIADGVGKTFAQGEDVKISFYTGQTTFEAEDPAVNLIQTKAQDFMKRLSQQITQSIIAYRRASGRAAPVRILLTGRGSLLAGLPEYLSEAQKVSVDYFNPTLTVGVGSRVDRGTLGQLYYQISETVGEAVRLVKPDAMGVNLLPPIIKSRLQFQKQKPFLVLAAAALAIAPLPMLYRYYEQKALLSNETSSWDAQSNHLRSIGKEIDASTKDADDTIALISKYEGLYNSRFNWITFFAQLQDALVETQDIWIDSMIPDRELPVSVPVITHTPSGNSTGGRNGNGGRKAAAAAAAAARQAPAMIYTLKFNGRMLLRDIDPDNPKAFDADAVKSTINKMLKSFNDIPFVQSVAEGPLDFGDKRMIGFEFTVTIKPENPL